MTDVQEKCECCGQLATRFYLTREGDTTTNAHDVEHSVCASCYRRNVLAKTKLEGEKP